MEDPLEICRRAGHLDHSRGFAATDPPPFRDAVLRAAWIDGWIQRQSDIDAVRSLGEKTSAREAEVAGLRPVAPPA